MGPIAARFYGELFGWRKGRAHDMGAMGTYQIFEHAGNQAGGMCNVQGPSIPPSWLSYVHVADSNRAVAAAKATGGRLMHGPIEVPGGSWIALMMDPQGGAFAVQEAPRPATQPRPATAASAAPRPATAPKPAMAPQPTAAPMRAASAAPQAAAPMKAAPAALPPAAVRKPAKKAAKKKAVKKATKKVARKPRAAKRKSGGRKIARKSARRSARRAAPKKRARSRRG